MEHVTDMYAADLLQFDIVQESFKAISEKSQRIQDLLVIKASIEIYGLDPAVMAVINKDDQLVKELRLTENDLNRSQEGLSDVFNSGIMKKIIDGIKWLIAKIIEGIKWVWNKLLEWINKKNIDKATLKRAADNWDKLPDNAPLQPPNSKEPEVPWTNIPNFKECKNRLDKSKRLCDDFINRFLSPLSEFTTAYLSESIKNPKCLEFRTIICSDKFKDLRKNFGIMMIGNTGNILRPAIEAAYRKYTEEHNISISWSTTKIDRIAEVRVKRDLGVQYKGEFNEVGITLDDLNKTVTKSKTTITDLTDSLKKISVSYDAYVKQLLVHADALEQNGDNYTADMERNTAARYQEEVVQINDLLNTINFVNSTLAIYIQIGTVNKLGIQELLKDMEIMFK